MPANFLSTEDWVEPVTLVVGTLGLLIIINGLKKVLTLVSAKTYCYLLYGLAGLIVLTQLWVGLNFIDVARADFYAIRTQAISLAQGSTNWISYYKVYPHNVNSALFEAMLLRPLLKLGITSPWAILNIFRFIWIDTGLISELFIIKHWNRWKPGAFFLLLTWLLSVPVYSYGLVAYNDEIVMPLILNFAVLGWLFKNKTGWIRWTAGFGSWLLQSL